MKQKIKDFFKDRSIFLFVLTLVETILAIYMILSFVYSDSLNYSDSILLQSIGIQKLLENMYSSTWWGLILFLLSFISVFSITSLVYKKLEYLFISILLWVFMGICAINVGNNITINLSELAIFIPVIVLNTMAYYKQKDKLKINEPKVEIVKKPTKKKSTNKKSV
jgi:hypothetical protein